jgi:hypothetical protein
MLLSQCGARNEKAPDKQGASHCAHFSVHLLDEAWVDVGLPP